MYDNADEDGNDLCSNGCMGWGQPATDSKFTGTDGDRDKCLSPCSCLMVNRKRDVDINL